MNTKRLVKKAKKGNKEALLQLIMKDEDAYYRLAFTYMDNEHDSLDALEDMIVKLYENIHQLKKDDAFYSWSKTILVNCCKKLLNKQKRFVLTEDWQEHIDENVANEASNNPYLVSEQQMEIEQLLSQLTSIQREAILLKYIHDFEYEMIASIMNVPVGTVKSRVFNGLKKLKEFSGGNTDEGN